MSQRNVSGVIPQRNVSLGERENKTCDYFDCFLILVLFSFSNYLSFNLIKKLWCDEIYYLCFTLRVWRHIFLD